MKLADMPLKDGRWSTAIGKLWWVMPSGAAWTVERAKIGGGFVHIPADETYEGGTYRLRRSLEVKTLSSVLSLSKPARTGATR